LLGSGEIKTRTLNHSWSDLFQVDGRIPDSVQRAAASYTPQHLSFHTSFHLASPPARKLGLLDIRNQFFQTLWHVCVIVIGQAGERLGLKEAYAYKINCRNSKSGWRGRDQKIMLQNVLERGRKKKSKSLMKKRYIIFPFSYYRKRYNKQQFYNF